MISLLTLPAEEFSVILSLLDTPALAKLAPICRRLAADVRAEMQYRVGHRNYELLRDLSPPMKGNRTTYLDLRYFYIGVKRPEDLPRVAVMLTMKYFPDVDYIRARHNCYMPGIGSIISHWIHVGLPACARLILTKDSRRYNRPYYGCGGVDIDLGFWGVRIIDNPAPGDSQYLLLFDAVAFSQKHYCPYERDDRFRAFREIIDRLDGPHFNLLVDMTAWMSTSRAVFEEIIASNHHRPRYDPWFVNRTLARMPVLQRIDFAPLMPDIKSIAVAGEYIPDSWSRIYLASDDPTDPISVASANWKSTMLRETKSAYIKKYAADVLNVMGFARQFRYFHMSVGPPMPADVAAKECADCAAMPPLVEHQHHKYEYDDIYPIEGCKCKCVCGAVDYAAGAGRGAANNKFAVLTECYCCRCCKCAIDCVCDITCDCPCDKSCTCCECETKCICARSIVMRE